MTECVYKKINDRFNIHLRESEKWKLGYRWL
nr:MAG TPA: hypothetical protein [Caudoviricetes sp.]